MSGHLGDDGWVDEQDVTQHTLHEDSIQCEAHPGARVEKLVDGRWTVERRCEWEGAQRSSRHRPFYASDVTRCDNGRTHFGAYVCPRCDGSGWELVPVAASIR